MNSLNSSIAQICRCKVVNLINFLFSPIVSSENEVHVSKCHNTEDVASNTTYEYGLEEEKYIRIRGKSRNHFQSFIADIFPKNGKSHWIEDSVDKSTIQTEMPDIEFSPMSSKADNMKIKATMMLQESTAPETASHTESSSESSQLGMLSNFEPPVKDLNTTFQMHKDDDQKLENKTNVVTVDATAEDIPSFREWAEKHLAAEEKERGEDNNTNVAGNGKVPKMRNKNYASPDCGAKLLSTNSEAKEAGSFLSSSRDEYLLNPCNCKIWFVIELCEAVQLKKIELANFELFSSSPRDFSVFISDHFPSRDWSLIGQFTAKDEKSVQSFGVKPRHFTKYIKVEFHTHYGREHFCPISLFRVYGTSEFEVLETVDSNDALGVGTMGSDEFEQNVNNEDLDDDDVIEPIMNESESKSSKTIEASNNLFGSARDVVINIVKKAAEALVNVPQQNRSDVNVDHQPNATSSYENRTAPPACITLKYLISCSNCEQSYFVRVYNLISCHLQELEHMLLNKFVRMSMLRSNVCAALTWSSNHYIIHLLTGEIVTALCHLLDIETGKAEENVTMEVFDRLNSLPSLDTTISGNVSVHGFADENLVPGVETDSFSNVQMPGDFIPSHSSTAPKFSPHSRITNSVPFTSADVKLIQVSIDGQTPVNGDLASQIKPTKTISLESQRPVRVDASVPSGGFSSVTFVPPPIENADHNRAKVVRSDDDDSSNKDTTAGIDQGHGAEVTDDSMAIDSLISEWEKSEGAQPAHSASAPSKPIPQKESVFVRLANRIKTLERNMSLSGQYLEELSRRYKKQVEDMQRVLTEAAEVRQKSMAREAKLSQEVATLNRHVAELTTAVEGLVIEREGWGYRALMIGEHSLIVFLEVAIFILIVCLCRGIPNVEISKRKFSLEWNRGKTRLEDETSAPLVALKRRQSFNDLTISAKPTAKRRPSEEALKIDGATHQDLLIYEAHRGSKTGRKRRKRKELLLKSNANAINLETGGDTLLKKKTNLNSMSAPLSRSASTSEIDDRCWTRIDCQGGEGNGRRNLTNSLNGSDVNGSELKENVKATNEREWPTYLQTATSARTKRLSAKYNGRKALSPVYDVSSDPDSSVPSTPVKEKKMNGLKKIVKKFF